MRLNATTTQEKAWMLRAAWELTRERTRLDIVVNGKPAVPRLGAVRLSPSAGLLDAGLVIQNRGDAPIWRDVSVQGTPSLPPPAEASGLTLKKTVWTLAGQPADLAQLKQNDRVMVVARRADGGRHGAADGGARPLACRTRDRNAARWR